MTDEPPRRGSGSGRLWTDPREEDEHTDWLAPKTAVTEQARAQREPEPEPPAPRQRIWPFVALGTLIAVVLFGAGLLGASLLRGDDSSSDRATRPAANGAGGTGAAANGAAGTGAASRTARRIYASVRHAIVRVQVPTAASKASGTGFLVGSDGTVMTAAHLVAGASRVQVRFGDSSTNVGADVLGSDESSDLAVLRVDPSKADHRRPLPFANSDAVRVGDVALAIGYPLRLDEAVTEGIVSGVGRAIRAPNGLSIDKVIQTDAPTTRGNSGGPLIDDHGRVIGVNLQSATPGGLGGSAGVGYAVPSNAVRQIVPWLRAGGTIRRGAYLGITSGPSTAPPGALVAGVEGGGGADRGGVLIGDVITGIDGHPVQTPDDIRRAIADRSPGAEVDIDVERAGAGAGARRTLRVTLGTQPANAPSAPAGP